MNKWVKGVMITASLALTVQSWMTASPSDVEPLSGDAVSVRIPKELKAIQKEGHFYYRINRKTQRGIYGAGGVTIKNPFHVLPKNSAGSCSHEVAIKIKLLRERLSDMKPIVAVYDMKVAGRYYPHTVVVIENPLGGYFVLNNKNMYVSRFSDLTGFRNIQFMTYEEALIKYNPN